jgi:tetratricopeptide (TPR) repeat protein
MLVVGAAKANAAILLSKAGFHLLYKELSLSIECMESSLSYFLKEEPNNKSKAIKIQKSLCEIYLRNGKFEEAIKCISSCISISKSNPTFYTITFGLMWKKNEIYQQIKNIEEQKRLLNDLIVKA